jgi:hypothetical protein
MKSHGFFTMINGVVLIGNRKRLKKITGTGRKND